MLSCQVRTSVDGAEAVPASRIRWVRTAEGWERPDTWHAVEYRRPTLHPVVVATGQVLISSLALVAFHRGK